METKHHKNRSLIWILIVAGLLVAALGIYIASTIPIYPAFSKEVSSLEKVKKELSGYKDTESIVVIDPAELELETTEIHLLLHGRTWGSAPRGYFVRCPAASVQGTDISVDLHVSAEPTEDTLNGTLYRGMKTSFSVSTSSVARFVELAMICNGVRYAVIASYPLGTFLEPEADAPDEQVAALLYRVADLVIDGAA